MLRRVEALGFHVEGLIVAPDVMAALKAESVESAARDDSSSMLDALSRVGLRITESKLLPPGCIFPDCGRSLLRAPLPDFLRTGGNGPLILDGVSDE